MDLGSKGSKELINKSLITVILQNGQSCKLTHVSC